MLKRVQREFKNIQVGELFGCSLDRPLVNMKIKPACKNTYENWTGVCLSTGEVWQPAGAYYVEVEEVDYNKLPARKASDLLASK
jgi:hypothetical protein